MCSDIECNHAKEPRVLVLLNKGVSTSIALEIAAVTNWQTPAEVIVASFYNDDQSEFDPDVANWDIRIEPLGASFRTSLSAYHNLRELIKSESIDVLHTHRNSVGSMSRVLTYDLDVGVVNTEHNDHRHFSTAQWLVNAVSLPLTHTTVVNSEQTLKSFNWVECTLARFYSTEVIYNGINIDKIDRAIHEEVPVDLPDEPFILTASVMSEQKNHSALLRAHRQLVEQLDTVPLVVVGSGPLEEKLRNQAKSLGIEDTVQFTGYIETREGVYSIMQQASLFVVPSWYEGFCVAAVEAMASGLPVVASDIEVLHEVVGEPGVFVDPSDPKDIAAAVGSLLDDDARQERLGKRSAERARSEFSIERTAEQYYELYKRVAEET